MSKERKSTERTPLTAPYVAQVALRLIDTIGLEEFSMRKLGHELDREAMAVYTYFPNKDAILDAVIELLLAEIEVPPAGQGWENRVRGMCRNYVETARTHPGAFPLLVTRRFRTSGSLAFLERVFAALAEEGFTPQQSADIFRLVGAFSGGNGLDVRAQRTGGLAFSNAVKGLGFPHVSEAVPHLSQESYDGLFDRGVEMIVAGIRAYREGKL